MSPLRVLGLAAILALITVSTTAQTRPQTAQIPGTAPIDPHRAMLTTYCVTCHNGRAKVGGLALDGLNIQAPAENADIWEKALRKLRGRLMPPPGNPQPQQKISIRLSPGWRPPRFKRQRTEGGYVPIQRLNRTEYAASVKALVGVDVNAKDVLPQDIQFGGFRQHRDRAEHVSRIPGSIHHGCKTSRREARLAAPKFPM
jgi:hypothetical protein